jgi:3-oxoacyl-[acyl-carrier protein] reductase
MDLTGKVAVITGASSGIGRGIALEFAKAGAAMALNYRSDDNGMIKTIEAVRKIGAYAKGYKADISKSDQVNIMFQNIIKDFGKIDILVNNAGISKVGLFTDATDDDINEITDINLKGAIYSTQNALKCMLPLKKGNIINISSMWGSSGASCEVLYSATKGAVNAFTKALAKELGPSNIRVNAIAPGVINTRMNSFLSENEKENIIDEIPLLRFGESCEIGKLALFLASQDSSYITGQIISIDGGIL